MWDIYIEFCEKIKLFMYNEFPERDFNILLVQLFK